MRVSVFAVVLSVWCACALVGCGGSGSGSGGGGTQPRTLTVSSISPATLSAGAAATTVTVTGSGFTSTTVVQINGVAEATTYVSSTQLTASVPAVQLATGGELSVVVADGALTSGSGAQVNLEVDNPLPAIQQLAPSSAYVTGVSQPIVVTGTGFLPGTTVQVGGTSRTVQYVSPTQLNVTLTAADLSVGGTLNLVATNATPGGGSSAAASFVVNNPLPGGVTVKPAIVPTGGTSPLTVTVTGVNFVPTSTVTVGGAARPTTYVNSTTLTFQLTVADQAAVANFSVAAISPAPGGGSSGTAVLQVLQSTPTPVLTTVSPNTFVMGSSLGAIVVSGSNLNAYDTVLWNGTALPTTTFTTNPVSLRAVASAGLLAATGTANVTVTSPTSTPAVSNALPVTIMNPLAPVLQMIVPTVVPMSKAATVGLSGLNFTSSSTVAYNGVTIPSTYSAGGLTVTIPASSLSLPGTGTLTVTQPAPGGGTSAPLTLTTYIPIQNNDAVYNPVNGLVYVSAPSAAGPVYGNSVVPVDPQTGALGTPIRVGSEPNKLAITSDGKYLWVGLDGSSAVRQVDLTAGTAGLQFSLPGDASAGTFYSAPATALALAALPGSSNSVVLISTASYAPPVMIYDNGVPRGPTMGNGYSNLYGALQVDGTKQEIYAAGSGAYAVYTFSSTGVTQKATATNGQYTVGLGTFEIQVAGGRAYSDSGAVFDAETGSLLGTLYSSGTNPAVGPVVADTTLGKAFVLVSAAPLNTPFVDQPYQIQTFNLSDYTSASSSSIPLSTKTVDTLGPTKLMRWGVDGLAFRAPEGIYSVRSNLVKDVSSVATDLAVTVSAPATAVTGANTTYTATVTNDGPAAATGVSVVGFAPSGGLVVSATPSAGSCSISGGIRCNLGGLANGATATVAIVVTQMQAGTATLTAQVSGSETDSTQTNNQASASVAVTVSVNNPAPTVSAISPVAIEAGAGDTTLTVTGTGFVNGSTVKLGTTTLSTTYGSGTQLTAIIPAAQLASMGWAPITVTNSTPGGGTSSALPLTIYSVVQAGLNRIVYEPFTRKLYASVGAGSSSLAGSSIVAITPETGTFGTPVSVASQPTQPTKMAISDDGNIMYVLLSGVSSFARFNLQSQQVEFTVTPGITNFTAQNYRDLAVQTGSENELAVDFGYQTGMGLFTIDPVAKTGSLLGAAETVYTGTSLHFYNASTLYSFDTDGSAMLNQYPVTSAGWTYNTLTSSSSLSRFQTFKLSGKIGFADAGGVADVTTQPAMQLGYFAPTSNEQGQLVEPDTSLGLVFFLTTTASHGGYGYGPDSVVAYDPTTYLPVETLPLNMEAIEGTTSFSGADLIRWGQDGLAALTSSGRLYLLRGPSVAPQEMKQNAAAVLSASPAVSLTHGAGNTIVTLTGSNFVPGVAVMWNGSYRFTRIVDSTHLSVWIPGTDLAPAGSAAVTAVNPGASASNAVTVAIN